MSGVQGVGITSSVDSPGEAALMILLIQGMPHPAIPPVIDGLRTRIRESTPFRAGLGDPSAHTLVSRAENEKIPFGRANQFKTAALVGKQDGDGLHE